MQVLPWEDSKGFDLGKRKGKLIKCLDDRYGARGEKQGVRGREQQRNC